MALILFAKNPVPGKVKTRLARDLGNQEAYDIYLRLVARTRQTALGLPTDRFLYYSDFIDTTDQWPAAHFQKRLQRGADLGDRMRNAFEEVLGGGFDRAVIIGTDCPAITPALLAEAFEKLQSGSLVVGPALDGGYYLLGMRGFFPTLFEHIDWSTEKVLDQTLQRAGALNLIPAFLPALSDIDTIEDWERFQSSNQMGV